MIEIKRAILTTIALIIVIGAIIAGGSFGLTAPIAATEPPSISSAPPSAEPVEEPVPSPTPTPEPTPEIFEISFIGDITPDSVSYFRGTDTAYQNVVTEADYVFEHTRQYFENDDFTLANFECVLTDNAYNAADKAFVFSAPTWYADMLKDGSVEFVTLGNNHVLDYGQDGYDDTKAAIDAVGVGYAGRDEYTIFETESGLKIGVYAVSFGYADQIKKGVQAVRDAGADFVIAALHWGDEGAYRINALQIEQGHAAIDAGADVVYGSHPHTLQPVESYNGKYIFYSMGNWSFGGNTDPRDKDTVIAKLEVTRDVDGSVSVTGVTLIPCASSGIERGNNYQPVPYEEGSEEYNRVLSKLDGTFDGQNLTIGYEYGIGELQ